MRDIILRQHEQITHSLEVNNNVRSNSACDSIILAGMGGSGHPGDLLNSVHVTNVPLTVHRSYDVPLVAPRAKWGRNPLVIVSSYSGNTEEALSAYHRAHTKNYSLLINTAGGELKELSEHENIPLSLIDHPGMQPRHTLLASFTGVASALINSGLADDIRSDLTKAAVHLETTTPTLETPSMQLAHSLAGTTPIVAASHNLAFAAQNFKIQINENAKTPAFWNEFPELNHNEMVGFTHPQGKFHAIFLRDKDDHPRIRARMDVTRELYEQWGIPVSMIDIKGSTLLEKLFYATIAGLWTSYYLALEYGIDPIPVEGVESFKAQLKKQAGDL